MGKASSPSVVGGWNQCDKIFKGENLKIFKQPKSTSLMEGQKNWEAGEIDKEEMETHDIRR